MERNNPKTHFNYDEYKHLFQVISSSIDEFALEDLEAVNDALNYCRKYVETVDMTEQQIMMAQIRFEGSEYRDAITRYDTQRRHAHEAAIASASLLNKISDIYGCQKIYNGTSDRLEVADFCLDVVVQVFKNRRV